MTRRFSYRVALRVMDAVNSVHDQYGPIFTGLLVALAVVATIGLLAESWPLILGCAGVAICLVVWVWREAPAPERSELDADYDALQGRRDEP